MRVETVIGSGLRSAQPTPSADAIGQLYVVTDEDIVERWDGDSWEQIATNASSIAALDDIGDVDAAAPAVGDVLTWDGSAWTAAPTGGAVPPALRVYLYNTFK